MVRADFSLTAENTADVFAICRRLDGLPLAIELAAARVRLLSPAALLARLSSGLELADSGVDRPARQKTLHAAIAWSYELLEPSEQAFFRQLGVFAGGADLDAVSAVTADRRDQSDPIDLLASLADANLVKLTEDEVGEPRVELLETIRAFALRELDASSTADDVRRSHARHYAALAETLRAQVMGPTDQVLRVRRRHQLELDNLRAGMAWAVSPGPNGKVPEDRAKLGLALAAPQAQLWLHAAHYTEAREWLERVIAAADQRPSRDLARCLNGLAVYLAFEGHLDRALDAARATVAMCRELGEERGLLVGMTTLAQRQSAVGDIDGARTTYDEARGIAEQVSDHWALALATVNLASLESDQGNYESALELHQIAQHLFNDVGDDLGALWGEYGIVQTLRRGGHVEEAERRLRQQVPALLRLAEPHMLINASEELAMILSERRGYRWSARLLGAATATRQRQASRREPAAEAELERQLSNARAALTPDTWSREHRIGEGMDLGRALAEAASETSAPVTPAP
jgi:tetratricopeptide (TPR) repeat protein